MNPLDIAYVRKQFPGLAGDYAFMDNAGGSMVLQGVADRVADYLLNSSVQLGASYAPSVAAGERVMQARRSVMQLINAAHPDEVIMGGSTTHLLQILCRAIAPSIAPGDEIIVTNCDHEANIGPWVRLCADRGATLRVWEVDPDSLELELDDLQALLGDKTRYVAVTHASNILGSINPVAEIARRVHAVGAQLCVDAVAYAPHRLVDVQASGADFYVYSFYKTFGPHFAVLWGRRDLLLDFPSLNHFFIGQEVVPYKLQPGNVNYELSFGCIGISDYLLDIANQLGIQGSERERMQAAFDAFEIQEDALAERLLGFLRQRPGVRIIGKTSVQARVPTISFVVEGVRSEAVVLKVDEQRIGIRFGDFYARRLIEALGLAPQGGVVRVSLAHYNTLEEIDRLIAALDQAITELR
ncbi:MAG: cysteine desulfurase-like protein [Pseudomonas sp. PGPPP4]|uniref:Cysteine desulfurase family protein (TIGR01976 family) n=1 Tax=Ectopseudomonas oleovorans TaxID=301 RepID=A0A3D9EUM9_ECTOL|nr:MULTISPECIES: cysteine desulfurase-like protein [Pseudomonas]MBA1257206.1 cysteine desulfurase-like protein [Pseudomonas psychrotolerans]MDU4055544.1 cysteine desulfurase-like protein [Pseudomonas oryzihabitans]NMZ63478.1 cysteine desulfurase-like protein [Pseudomonas oryzihabitans]OYT85181.1 MAG: cysteine desulfurase-like protein [Pseudomonas sp. PGPPP4]RAU42643.1 cysteine desulfurase-like protein [Pseudomonas sp. RIT 411]